MVNKALLASLIFVGVFVGAGLHAWWMYRRTNSRLDLAVQGLADGRSLDLRRGPVPQFTRLQMQLYVASVLVSTALVIGGGVVAVREDASSHLSTGLVAAGVGLVFARSAAWRLVARAARRSDGGRTARSDAG
jgi:hypothetical protein